MITLDDDSETDGSSDADPVATTSTSSPTPPPATTAVPPPPGTTTTPPSDDSTDGGVSFIPPHGDPGDNVSCDLFEQDCPRGEKCMPWANDGGNTWNAVRCSPVVEDPGQPGDPCLVEGSPVSGLDTCDVGAMCWDVDPATLEGTCVAMCTGEESNPICEDRNSTCQTSSGGLPAVCVPQCNPLDPDCADGQACYPFGETFTCTVDASGDMGVAGDPCEFFNVCDPGLVCASAEVVPDCMSGVGCCSPFCSLDDPMPPCLPEQVCTPWYDLFYEPGKYLPPPGYESVGLCVLP
ncbi:MAG: ribulose phosphate epimerase [Nannocystaceae bacterium]